MLLFTGKKTGRFAGNTRTGRPERMTKGNCPAVDIDLADIQP